MTALAASNSAFADVDLAALGRSSAVQAADRGGAFLNVASETTSPPMDYINPDSGAIVGFEADLVNAIGEPGDGKGESFRVRFCRKPGAIIDGPSGDLACDHCHLWQDAISRMPRLGLEAYGYAILFGSVHVDMETRKRSPKLSALS